MLKRLGEQGIAPIIFSAVAAAVIIVGATTIYLVASHHDKPVVTTPRVTEHVHKTTRTTPSAGTDTVAAETADSGASTGSVLTRSSAVPILKTKLAATIAAPTGLTLNKISTIAASLVWQASTTAGITAYNVYRDGTKVATTDSYTTNYLDTGLTPGSTYQYTVTAQKDLNTLSPASSTLTASTGSATVPIATCGNSYSATADYILTNDVSFTGGGKGFQPTCIDFSNASNVSLDCNYHTITMNGGGLGDISMDAVSHFLITNCTLVDTGPGDTYSPISIADSDHGTLQNNIFGQSYTVASNQAGLDISASNNLVIAHNNFVTSSYDQITTTNSFIGQNTLTWDSPVLTDASINSGNGSNNLIYANTIDGGATSANGTTYTDDGVGLGGTGPSSSAFETDDVVAYNTISNVFDAGIEGIGTITGTTIDHNTVTNAWFAGIGSYHYTNWRNNVISNNTLTTVAPYADLLDFEEIEAVPSGQTYNFTNNQFIGNIFNPDPSNITTGISIAFSSTHYQLANNLLQNNNLTHSASLYAPYLNPVSMIIDGGGNVCTNQSLIPPPIGIVCN